MCCLLPKGRPRLFWIHSNSKVLYLNLEFEKISLVLHVRAALSVETYHIVQSGGYLFPEILLVLAQPNFWSRYGSVEPYIFGGVITIPTLRRVISEGVNYEFSISHI